MSSHSLVSKKIAIIGSGFVGTSFAYAAMIRNIATEIILYDRNFEKAEGEAMDLDHGLAFVETGGVRAARGYDDLAEADIIVITAGLNQKPGQTRLDLIAENAKIMKEIITELDRAVPEAILLIVSNPVDILTSIAARLSKRPKEKIIGSGTVLDTARLHYLLGKESGVSPHSVGGYILGEHGDSEFVAWSTVDVGGNDSEHMNISPVRRLELERETRDAAYEIIKRKSATYFGIGLALCEIVESIVYDQRMVLSVSVPMHPMVKKDGVALGLPTIIGCSGAEGYVILDLTEEESVLLEKSVATIDQYLRQVL